MTSPAGRPSLLAWPTGSRTGRTLVLDGHLDVVGAGAMPHPFEPRVDGDLAAVEYWAVTYPNGEALTISGCTLLRFDDEGLVAEARDYSHVKQGRFPPPTDLFD